MPSVIAAFLYACTTAARLAISRRCASEPARRGNRPRPIALTRLVAAGVIAASAAGNAAGARPAPAADAAANAAASMTPYPAVRCTNAPSESRR